MKLSFLLRLFSHMAWADAVVWQAVLAEDSVGGDEYILDSLTHLHVVQRAYLHVLARGRGRARRQSRLHPAC